MGKIIVLFCFALLAMTLVMAADCGTKGMPCASHDDCCSPLWCKPWAQKCVGRGWGWGWWGQGPEEDPEAQ